MKDILKKTLHLAIEGITSLSDLIDSVEISSVVELLANKKGKVIVTGMGKSGHIGIKMSTTLSSLGCSSFYLHPAEASHGDLGMIDKNDILIIISNSGESKELDVIIGYAKVNNIPVVAITKNKKSSLFLSATFGLVLPESPEPLDLNSPMVSATQTLVLCDAICAGVATLTKFSKIEYAKLHPGGKLGLVLTSVYQRMEKIPTEICTDRNISLKEAAIMMCFKSYGFCIILKKDGSLDGIITDGDLRRSFILDKSDLHAFDVMTTNCVSLRPESSMFDVFELFKEKKVNDIVIVDNNNKPVGLIRRKFL